MSLQKIKNCLSVAYDTKETWVVLGNITSRIMLPMQSYDFHIPTIEAFLRWTIQSFTLLWIGIILTNIAHDSLQKHPNLVKPFAFLCGFSPTTIINILITLTSNHKLPLDMVIPLLEYSLQFENFILSLYNL